MPLGTMLIVNLIFVQIKAACLFFHTFQVILAFVFGYFIPSDLLIWYTAGTPVLLTWGLVSGKVIYMSFGLFSFITMSFNSRNSVRVPVIYDILFPNDKIWPK